MEGSVNELALYRLSTAREDLGRAKKALDDDDYKLLLNRSYYAIFHSLRAVNALDRFDSSKHKGVISHFNKEHVKNGDFSPNISKMIANAMDGRQKSDYEDFYVISKEMAIEQYNNAEYIVGLVNQYILKRIEK